MWGHTANCPCAICHSLPRIFHLIETGSRFAGFVPQVGERIRLVESEIRDILSFLDGTRVFSRLPGVLPEPPVLSGVPPLGGVVPGSVAPPKESGLGEKQAERRENPSPKSKEAGPLPGISPKAPAPVKWGTVEPYTLVKQEQGVDERGPVQELPRVEGSEEERTSKQEREKEKKRSSPRDNERSRSRKRRKEKRKEEKSKKKDRDTSENKRSEDRKVSPRSSGREKKKRERSEEEAGEETTRRENQHTPNWTGRRGRGRGWQGELPVSHHPRWRGVNKGQVKRAKQEVYNNRYR